MYPYIGIVKSRKKESSYAMMGPILGLADPWTYNQFDYLFFEDEVGISSMGDPGRPEKPR